MMYDVILLFVGAIVGAVLGVTADVLLRQSILSLTLRIKRETARLARRADPLAGRPSQLRFGNIITEWVSLHGTGEAPLRHQYLRTSLIEEYVPLPKELEELRNRCREELDQKAQDGRSDVWNGERFTLVDYYPTRYGRTEEAGLNFEFRLTDYAAFLAITSKLDELGRVKDDAGNPTTIRDRYFPCFDPEKPNPFLTHSFGINLAVITKDRKIMLTQRNAFVAIRPKCYHISMNEGMQYPLDMDERGQPSFLKAAIRGLWEELGVEPKIVRSKAKAIEFLNFGALAKANEYAILGRVKLPIDSRELEQMYHTHAKDKGMETRHELYAVDYIPEAILEFVNDHSPWAHNCLATLYFVMIREWGCWQTRLAFSRHKLDWGIVGEA